MPKCEEWVGPGFKDCGKTASYEVKGYFYAKGPKSKFYCSKHAEEYRKRHPHNTLQPTHIKK